jgi:hypothetical protein
VDSRNINRGSGSKVLGGRVGVMPEGWAITMFLAGEERPGSDVGFVFCDRF